MSGRPRRSQRREADARANGHTGDDGWLPIEYNRPHTSRAGAGHAGADLTGQPPTTIGRRAAAARARQRRLRSIDLALGVALALLVIVLAPGLAIAALLAAIVLLGFGVSLAVGQIRRRRRAGH